MDSESEKLEIALRIQKRIAAEARQTLLETQEALEASQAQVETLKEEIRTKQAVMDQRIEQAEAQLELVAQKDQMIKMLQQRVTNINNEYNKRYGGRRATTLEDVHKLTGEVYSKDDHRS